MTNRQNGVPDTGNPPPKKEKAARKPPKKAKKTGKPGRPPKIAHNQKTLDEIRKLAAMQCTEAEAAAWFECDQATFNRFLHKHQKAKNLWETGHDYGRMSLRRAQFASAITDKNVTMQIFLGKNWLGQADKAEVKGDLNLTGAGVSGLLAAAKKQQAERAGENGKA